VRSPITPSTEAIKASSDARLEKPLLETFANIGLRRNALLRKPTLRRVQAHQSKHANRNTWIKAHGSRHMDQGTWITAQGSKRIDRGRIDRWLIDFAFNAKLSEWFLRRNTDSRGKMPLRSSALMASNLT